MDDGGIVQLYWDRDERAIPETAAKYGAYCAKIARNILGSAEDAEECVNDTWLRAWNAIPPARPGVLPAFLGKITRNLSINRHARSTAAKRGGGEYPAALDELGELVSGSDSVEQELGRRELVRAIDAFLGALPADKRGIFVCRYWYFDSVSEIARRFGMPENNVSVTLHRLRAAMRDHLSERGFAL